MNEFFKNFYVTCYFDLMKNYYTNKLVKYSTRSGLKYFQVEFC